MEYNIEAAARWERSRALLRWQANGWLMAFLLMVAVLAWIVRVVRSLGRKAAPSSTH